MDALTDPNYKIWLVEIKSRYRHLQLKAAVAVNSTLMQFYWNLGADIVSLQKKSNWGQGLLAQISRDLSNDFPGMAGFSKRNLELIRQWHIFWSDASISIAKQPVSQLSLIPWGHNLAIIRRCKDHQEAWYYVTQTQSMGWSRAVLNHQIENDLWRRQGKATTNFSLVLQKTDSDLALQILKDPYVFDFLGLTVDHNERDLESALIENLTQFLLELGAGFAYIGRQILLRVGEREFFIDLLFFHTHLHCYLVIELKTGDFEPEFTGKLNFYLKAVDAQIRSQGDSPTIGLLICKSKDNLVAEYALSDVGKPMGIASYTLSKYLPSSLKGKLPSIESIEKELTKESNL